PGFDGIPDTLLQPDPVESVDFLQARGGSHIDLRHVIANDVDPDENQAPFLEGRTYRGTDVLFPGRKLRTLRFAPGMHIGAGLARRRSPVYGAGGLAIDQDDALVPLAPLRQVTLDDQWLAIERGEQLDDPVQVLVPRGNVKPPGPAIAEQRLDGDVLVTVSTVADLAGIGVEQRR